MKSFFAWEKNTKFFNWWVEGKHAEHQVGKNTETGSRTLTASDRKTRICSVLLRQISAKMKWMKRNLVFLLLLMVLNGTVHAQCSICTKNAQQLGEKPAKGMNSGILYLAFTPFLLIGYIGYRWWQSNKD